MIGKLLLHQERPSMKSSMQNMARFFTMFALILLITTSYIVNSQSQQGDTQVYPTGINILIYYDTTEPFSMSFTGFEANFTDVGNMVTIVSNANWNFLSDSLVDYDALFISVAENQILNNANNPEVIAIKNWFETGDKLLWVAGNSDFAGSWIASRNNPLLESIGTPLRFDAGAIENAESNIDGVPHIEF